MILIIANARIKGGLSGSDNIYLHFARYWPCCEVWDMLNIDFKPFWLCYFYRILGGCIDVLREKRRFNFVYSASDFLMDSLPALIMKLKGNKWVAGYYMHAPKDNLFYYFSQKFIRFIIRHFADAICITNEDMTIGKPEKEIIVRGGVDLDKAGLSNNPKEYDAVFIGRFHKTKGIDELMQIWDLVLKKKPEARLAVIGGGDSEEAKFIKWMQKTNGIKYFGYLGDERFEVYKRSRIVLYPTPFKYSHFSIAPVEAMACGCPMVAFDLPVMKYLDLKGCGLAEDDNVNLFVYIVLDFLTGFWKQLVLYAYDWAQKWDWEKQAKRVYNEICQKLR